jgi:beta-glucosidase
MTRKEKVMQLVSVDSTSIIENRAASREKMRSVLKDGIGQITRLSGSELGLLPREARSAAEGIQRFLMHETTVRIPAIIHEECLSGLMGLRGTVFPQSIGLACMWNRDLIYAMAGRIARQLRIVCASQGLAPVGDLAVDARWGRVEETFGEDPYLAAVCSYDYTRGLQGRGLAHGVIATMKSLGAHGFPEGGRNKAPINLGPRELCESFLFPFEVAVRLGGAMSVMTAYNEIDGVPCTESSFLLREKLKDEWGFQGIVVSDYDAIRRLNTVHHTARDNRDAAIRALRAGVDVELDNPVCFPELEDALASGDVSEDLVDSSVRRVLRTKLLLGLFDERPPVLRAKLDSRRDRKLSLEAARESLVLLKNDGVLPLPGNVSSIAVLGPCSDDPLSLMGDYSYANHVKLRRPGVEVATILAGFRRIAGRNTTIGHAMGTSFLAKEDDYLRAIELARESEVAIVAVGENSTEGGGGLSGEGSDSMARQLPDPQRELVERVCEVNEKTVVVLVNGRPLDVRGIAGQCAALVEAWYPGEEGGTALAEVIFGNVNPSGWLSISFPKDSGQIPAYYWRKPSSFGRYVDGDSDPLFPFGYGLSYSAFEYSDLQITPPNIDPGGNVVATFKVTNSGRVAGKEVSQLYVSKRHSDVTRPVRQLKGFAKFELDSNESRQIGFEIPTRTLAFYDSSMKMLIESGDYGIEIGSSSTDLRLSGRFVITGSRFVESRQPYLTTVRMD